MDEEIDKLLSMNLEAKDVKGRTKSDIQKQSMSEWMDEYKKGRQIGERSGDKERKY